MTDHFITPAEELELRLQTPIRDWIDGVKLALGEPDNTIVILDGVRYRPERYRL